MGEAAEAEDLWHVRTGPNEVKKLTLEQLDDLFRLDVISADTQIWQPGMDEWLPLSVVAGLGDDEPETIDIPISQPPPTTIRRVAATTQNVWPPAAPSSLPPPPSSRGIPIGSRPPPPPPSRSTGVTTRPPPATSRGIAIGSRPPPPPSRPVEHLEPVQTSWPPAAAWSDPPPPARAGVSGFAPTVAAGSTPFTAPLAPPLGVFEDTAPRARRGGGSGAWVVVLSAVVGLTVTLYRNDVVHASAKSMGQTATFMKLESALGGPGFGTPRAVEQMMTRPKLEAESVTTPVATTTSAATSAPATTSEPVAEAPRAATPAPEPPKAETPPPASKPAPAAAPVTRTVSATPASRSGGSPDPDKVFKQPKKGKKGNEYDPLNPSL